MNRLQPWRDASSAALAQVQGVLTDIDDTVTTEGRLTSTVLRAMEGLREAGLKVIPVTGRPFGWAYPLARLWPVDAVISENGAAYTYVDSAGVQHIAYYADEPTRQAHRAARERAAARVAHALPQVRLAQDNFARMGDVAFDIAENVPRLGEATVAQLVALLREEGLHTAVSSIHAHGWQGDYDKLSMSLRCLEERWGVSHETAANTWAFVGDSMNDAPMFGFFHLSVGVANVAQVVDRLPVAPRYVTQSACGEGFIEFAQALLRARGAPA
jgi:HAD superfamily hydrolase (TIGR01484 family)